MSRTIDCVRKFREAFGLCLPTKPVMLAVRDYSRLISAVEHLKAAQEILRQSAHIGCGASLYLSLEVEELRELGEAICKGDLAAALDAQVDRRYIADGTTLALGMGEVFDEAFDRVHDANMAKLVDGKPVVNKAGKVTKPDGWKAPKLGDLVKQ